MQPIPLRPVKHILVCTNERTDGRDCCANTGGHDIYTELKEYVKESGLRSIVWVTRTGCLGFCNKIGTTVVIYPEQIWFKEVRKEDMAKIKEMIG